MFRFGHQYTFTLVGGNWSLQVDELPDAFVRPIVRHDFGDAALSTDDKLEALAKLTTAIVVLTWPERCDVA